ncbi:MAG TPA: DUF4157 domain-containing protein [Pyrinomonadaceae bacterium]|jgi:hypothetical protein
MKPHSRHQISCFLPPSFTAVQSGILQRKCASCGNHTVAGDKCDECKNDVLQRKSSNNSAQSEAPPIVHEVLNSPGQPLDKTTRAFFESHFAHDFSKVPVNSVSKQMSRSSLKISEPMDVYEQEADRIADSIMLKEKQENKTSSTNKQQGAEFDLSQVRVHTDMRAAASARAVNAHAYTVGHNIVFGAGQYRPSSDTGRRLLGHELTHAIQQRGDTLRLQRQCVSSPCPPVLVPIDALFPRYDAAEKCIQTMYASSHPAKLGISLSYNAEWLHLTGGSPNQKMALSCLRGEETPGAGPNFTAKGLMYAAAPDMWDFDNRTMYEITTPSGTAFRVNKLGAQITLANKLCGPADCGGLQFDRGTWSPTTGCFALGGDLYFTARNTQGVIVYNMFKDAAKELALATVLAAMAAALKSAGPKAGTAAAGVGGKLVPAYAVASLAAMAVLLASGRAEAKLGTGGEEPLVSLFKELEKKGTKVPPEIQEMLDANPDLKEKMNKALGKGGDPSAVKEEINKQILDTIAANKDKFTAEELELLLASTQVAGKALPKGNMTAEELKKLAAAVKAGKTGGEGGEGSAPPSPKTEKTDADKTKDTGAKDVPADKDATPQLSQPIRDKLAKAPKPVSDLFKGLLGASPNAKKLSDAHVQRFLSMMPLGLTADQVTQLLKKSKAAKGETADQILDLLQAALADLNKFAAPSPDAGVPAKPGDKPANNPGSSIAPTNAPAPNVTITTGPTVSSSNKTTPEQLIKELAAKAKKSSFTDLLPGQYQITWKSEEKGKLTVGSFISGGLRGKLKNGTTYVGRIEAEVTEVKGRNLKIKFVTATPMVSADQNVVIQPDYYVNHETSVVLGVPAPKKK